jgi:large subunit ribosomal protein L32
MAMPKKRMTATRSGARRSQLALTRPAMTRCANCQATIRPHTVCEKCGYYRGKQVATV